MACTRDCSSVSSPGGLRPIEAPRERDIHAGFDPVDDVWKIVLEKGVTHISFRPIRDHWGDGHADNAKRAALAFHRRPRTGHSVANASTSSCQEWRAMSLSAATISAAGPHGLPGPCSLASNLHYLGHIATFLKSWVARGDPGVDRDVLQFFDSLKIPWKRQGHRRPHAPSHEGSLHGCWSFRAFTLAAREAHREGRVSGQDFAILLALTATGSRPGQLSMLTCGDLVPPAPESSAPRLLVPSLKKTDTASASRANGSSPASLPLC